MTAISFTAPMEPRGWARARKNGNRFFTDAETQHAKGYIGNLANVAMRGRMPLTGAVELTVTSIFAVPASWSAKKRAAALAGEIRPTGKPDFDNCAKLISDALNKIVWADDAQVVDGRSVKFYGPEPAMHVVVRQIVSPQSLSRTGGNGTASSGDVQQKAWAEGR